MSIIKLFLVISLASSVLCFAGAKDDFIQAMTTHCGKTEAQALQMATRGRRGNVMKLKTCTSESVTIQDCVISCADESSKIGGQ